VRARASRIEKSRRRYVLSPRRFATTVLAWQTAPVSEEQPKNPLHGVTLERIVTELFEKHGWESLARQVKIRCFEIDPSIKSSLTFLRRTPWARAEVEALYLRDRRERK
jgi:uncharacterized protein (DUF2132 family)